MKKIEVEVYSYEELSPKIQEKVLERYREWETQDSYWYEFILEDWKEKLEKIGFIDAKIYFSGFWSQGDGAFFEAKCDSITLINHLFYCNSLHGFNYLRLKKMLIFAENDLLDFGIYRYNRHYNHEKSGVITLNFNGHDMGKLDESLKRIELEIEDLRKSLCIEIYHDLQTEYEYITSNEYLLERYLSDTELFFYANGRGA